MTHDTGGVQGVREVPSVPLDGSSEPDKEAKQEFAEYKDQRLEQEARRLQHRRREGVRQQVHVGALLLIWLAIIVSAGMLVTWGFHLLAPEGYHYLSPDQYDELKNVLFSALLAAFVSEYAKKVL